MHIHEPALLRIHSLIGHAACSILPRVSLLVTVPGFASEELWIFPPAPQCSGPCGVGCFNEAGAATQSLPKMTLHLQNDRFCFLLLQFNMTVDSLMFS